MILNFPLSFRNMTLRRHRRLILLSREKSLLPAMQIFVEARRNMLKYSEIVSNSAKIYNEVCIEYNRLQTVYYTNNALYYPFGIKKKYRLKLKKQIAVIENILLKTTDETKTAEKNALEAELKATELSSTEKVEYTRLKDLITEAESALNTYTVNTYSPTLKNYTAMQRELRHWSRMFDTGTALDGTTRAPRREFIMRCSAEDCRGFISSSYVCGVCEKKTCSDCLEIIGEGDHACKPESIESAKMIKKETHACPKCGTRIYKIDGCDQMWCTVDGCNTAFSWNTGHVVTGRVHNPHYYEWLRRQGGGVEPAREVGDIPCGGLPHAYNFTRLIIRINDTVLTPQIKNRLLEIHRNVAEFEQRLTAYPSRPDALINKENNVKYLMNTITEEEWQRQLELTEAKFNRKKEIGQILQTLVTGAADMLALVNERATILYEISANNPIAKEFTVWINSVALPHLEALRTYTNNAYLEIAKAYHMAVPQISDTWRWEPIRAIYRKVGTKAAAVAAEIDEQPPPLDMPADEI